MGFSSELLARQFVIGDRGKLADKFVSPKKAALVSLPAPTRPNSESEALHFAKRNERFRSGFSVIASGST
jgi:hypothetical protein